VAAANSKLANAINASKIPLNPTTLTQKAIATNPSLPWSVRRKGKMLRLSNLKPLQSERRNRNNNKVKAATNNRNRRNNRNSRREEDFTILHHNEIAGNRNRNRNHHHQVTQLRHQNQIPSHKDKGLADDNHHRHHNDDGNRNRNNRSRSIRCRAGANLHRQVLVADNFHEYSQSRHLKPNNNRVTGNKRQATEWRRESLLQKCRMGGASCR
jgi:hypothetical protein